MSFTTVTAPPAPILSLSANAAAKDKDTDSRLSLSTGNSKDIRAYEHDRQKLKKAAELAKRKARKALHHEPKVHPTAVGDKHERLKVQDVDTLEGLVHDVADVRRIMPHSLPSRGVSHKWEVKLADLVTARKPRKGNDADFEVVPHVRSVIVLDDIGQDPASVEEWEYIRGQREEDGIARTRSYADILTTAK